MKTESTSQQLPDTTSEMVALYILSRDRPVLLAESIESALSQTSNNYKIIISDNSSSEEVAELISMRYPEITLVRRKPQLRPIEHIAIIIRETQQPLTVMFHDDDVLEPTFIENQTEIMKNNPSLCAVACNATIIKEDRHTEQRFFKHRTRKVISQIGEIASIYLKSDYMNPAPFSSYLYRSETLRRVNIWENQGGKHADVSLITNIVATGPIAWNPEPLIKYRIHAWNGSNTESIGDRKQLLRYLCAKMAITEKSTLALHYRFAYLAKSVRSRKGILRSMWKMKVLMPFFLKSGTVLLLTSNTFRRKVFESTLKLATCFKYRV